MALSFSSQVLAIGMGTPGPLSCQDGVIFFSPNLPGWYNVPIVSFFERRHGCRVVLNDDSLCACWGEYQAGAGRGRKSLVYITLGTGVGGGIVIDGKLVRGASDLAGNIGHMIVVPEGIKCGCGARGCLEQYASATAVIKNVNHEIRSGRSMQFFDTSDLSNLGAHDVVNAATSGCERCRRIIENAGYYLGISIGTIGNLIDPELVSISGGLARAGVFLGSLCSVRVKKHSYLGIKESFEFS